jgi:hypothetical protein
MMTLSTGMPSTLGSYKTLCKIFFGEDSAQYEFIESKIIQSPNGELEEVIAEESQMMYLLASMDKASSKEELMRTLLEL